MQFPMNQTVGRNFDTKNQVHIGSFEIIHRSAHNHIRSPPPYDSIQVDNPANSVTRESSTPQFTYSLISSTTSNKNYFNNRVSEFRNPRSIAPLSYSYQPRPQYSAHTNSSQEEAKISSLRHLYPSSLRQTNTTAPHSNATVNNNSNNSQLSSLNISTFRANGNCMPHPSSSNNNQLLGVTNSSKQNHDRITLECSASDEGSEKRQRSEQTLLSDNATNTSSISRSSHVNNADYSSFRVIEVRDLDKVTPDMYEALADLLLNSFHKYGMMTSQEELQFLLSIRENLQKQNSQTLPQQRHVIRLFDIIFIISLLFAA